MGRTGTLWFSILTAALACPALANDVIFLNGQVKLQGGAGPGRSVEIQLSCKGGDHPVRQTMTNKKGGFFLKVERDEFNHVARSLPTAAMDLSNQPMAGSCQLVAALPGYTSSGVDLGTFTIGKDLKLPELVLTPKSQH